MKKKDRKIQSNQDRRPLPSLERDKISDDKVVKISTDLFTYGKTRWKMGVYPFRLVCMVAQTLASEDSQLHDLKNIEFSYSLDKVFHYLGLEKNNARFDILFKTMEEAIGNVVQFKSYGPKGGVRWTGMTLISYCSVDEDTNRIIIQPSHRAVEYLVDMRRWCALQPKYYLKLSGDKQNWFYAFLRKEAGLQPYIIVDIDTIKEMLSLDDTKSYDPKQTKNANENFFRKVLGIEKPKGWKYNKDGENTPWNFTIDKDTNKIIGTLGVISEKTDIIVTAYPIKEGRTYTKICISIKPKSMFLSKSEKEKLHENISKYNIEDMGKPEKRGRSKKGQPAELKASMQGLFDHVPIVDSYQNPMSDESAIPKGKIIIQASTFRMLAEASHVSEEEYYETLKNEYIRLPNGDYEKI